VAVVGIVAISAVVAVPGQAAFPGDNGRLAFTAFSGSRPDIFTIAPDGSDLRNHTNHPATDADADLAADGSQFVFYSLRDGPAEIYKMQLNGTGVTRLTNAPGGNTEPAWSPDGSRIVFTSFRDGNAEIHVMNADGSGQKRLTNEPTADSEPVFSPDGSKIAFSSFRNDRNRSQPVPEIYIMNADGTDQTRLTTSPEGPEDPTGEAPAGNRDPDFSPDGSRIVFSSRRDANDPEPAAGRDFRTPEIYVMNVDGSDQTRLTNNTSFDRQPVFSPDGSKIAFRRNRPDEVQQIFTIDADDGSGLTQLTDVPSSKVLNDWGVRSDAPLDPPPPQPVPPPPVPPPPLSLQPLPPPGPPLTEPQRVTEVDRFGGWAAWSAFEEGVGYRLVLRDPDGEIGPASVGPRRVAFDVDLGPSEDDGVVAAYSRCEQEPDAYGAGGILLRTTGRGCDIFALDVSGGEEVKLEGASTDLASEYLPSIWRDSVAFARVYEQREGRRGDLPYLYVRPLEGRESERQPGGSRGDDGLPGPTGLDLYGRRMSFSWEWREGERLRSELRLDTVGGDHDLIERLGSQDAPANILTPTGDRGRIYAGARRLREDGHDDRLLRLRISTNEFTEAPLQGPPLVGLGVDEGNFLLATADDPRQAPLCGPGGCTISPLEFGSGD
jgi:Tol biopolymer transport system component